MIDINLVPQHLRKKQKSSALSSNTFQFPREALIGLLGGLFVLLFIVHFIFQMVIFVKFAQYKRAKKEWESILPEKTKADAVINQMRALQSKATSIEKVKSEKRILWSQKLNNLSDIIPRGVWLNKVSLTETIFLIDGSAVSKSRDEMSSVGNFASNLKSNPIFMQGLQSLELGSIQRRQLKTIDIVDFIVTVKLK